MHRSQSAVGWPEGDSTFRDHTVAFTRRGRQGNTPSRRPQCAGWKSWLVNVFAVGRRTTLKLKLAAW